MQAVSDWVYVGVGLASLLGMAFGGLRWLIRSYLRELVPNGGQSIKDQVNRLERQVEMLVQHLITDK